MIIIDLSGRDSLRYGPVRDPVKSLVECGIGDDVDTVIVDGKIVMQGGKFPGVTSPRFAPKHRRRARKFGQLWQTGIRSGEMRNPPVPGVIRWRNE